VVTWISSRPNAGGSAEGELDAGIEEPERGFAVVAFVVL